MVIKPNVKIRLLLEFEVAMGLFAMKLSTLQRGAVAEALPVWENGNNACWGVAFFVQQTGLDRQWWACR
jgi:hypothetical protein